jgi:hypothetical protein
MVRVLREPCAPRTECVDVLPMLERTDVRPGKAIETDSNGTRRNGRAIGANSRDERFLG